MVIRLLAMLLVGLVGTQSLAQRQEALFSLGREPIVRAIVTTTIDLPTLPDAPKGRTLPKMVLEASGVLEVIEGRGLSEVKALASRNAKPIGRPPASRSICFIHLIGAETTKTIEIVGTNDGLVVGEHAGTGLDRPARAKLNPVRWDRLRDGWSLYRGGFDAPADPIATPFEMPLPYLQGDLVFDYDTVRERFYYGQRLRNTHKVDRILDEDPIHVRLPQGYDPSNPAGLLVWISPTPRGSIPSQFYPALDELNLIAVGADNAGNGRMTNSRYQLAFDAIATVRERYHIDADRVYVTGMSGGGRISTMLGVCFPDVFAGAVPIVGMNIYEVTSRGDGKKWKRAFYRPSQKLFRILRTRRIAPMGGPPDFNYDEMQAATRVLKGDMVPIRFFSYDDMAHKMPKPERFSEAIHWVDEPYRQSKADNIAQAQSLFEEYSSRFGSDGNETDGDGAESESENSEALGLLLNVIETAPWSPVAWSALDLLRN